MKKLMTLLLLPTFAIADPGVVTQHFKNVPLSCDGGSFTGARPEAGGFASPGH